MKYIWSSDFPEAITADMQIENELFVFKYSVTWRQKINNFSFFYWNCCKQLSFICSHRNDKYNPSYLMNSLSINSLLRIWFLGFSWFSSFAFWGTEKHFFHIFPFRPTRYVLKSYRCLDVSNRVRKWNKFKKFIYVVSTIQLCQLEIPIFIYKLMCQCSLINSVSFLFCEFKSKLLF